MQKIYPLQNAGGKGNIGMFIERDPKICAAGMPSRQANESVADCLSYYSLQDEVECLIGDSIEPKPKPRELPPLRVQQKDYRHASLFSEASTLINPYQKTKFQTLVEDLKNTVYSSYWRKGTGALPDPTPNLPTGFDIETTLGKKTPFHGRLYDLVMPIDPVPDQTPAAKELAAQTDRKYCRPAFNPDLTYGKCMHVYHPGKWMKLCLRDDRRTLGLLNKPQNKQEVNFYNTKRAPCGKVLAPNNNVSSVPPGFSFGMVKAPDNLAECLSNCRMNPEREFFTKCLRHLNTLRKCLKKLFDAPFFVDMYLKLKYFDKSNTGWLPKQVVYDNCTQRHIVLTKSLLEPLLSTLNAYDGTQIFYETFVNIINHTVPIPELPKVWDVPEECLDYRTTYSEMVKPGQDSDKSMRAGLPSGRYFDIDYPTTPEGYCQAHKSFLPQETDVVACLNPSVLTLLNVSHRDMFAGRTPVVVRRVFEAAGEKFTDEKFETIWNIAKKEHSKGSVCYETFRTALNTSKANSADTNLEN